MGKFSRFKRFISGLKDKITWEVEYEWDDSNADYSMSFTSSKIADAVLGDIAGNYVKLEDKKLNDFKVGDSFSLSEAEIKHNQVSLLTGLPNYKNKQGHKFLTKAVVEVKYSRVEGGWVIFELVKGVRRLY